MQPVQLRCLSTWRWWLTSSRPVSIYQPGFVQNWQYNGHPIILSMAVIFHTISHSLHYGGNVESGMNMEKSDCCIGRDSSPNKAGSDQIWIHNKGAVPWWIYMQQNWATRKYGVIKVSYRVVWNHHTILVSTDDHSEQLNLRHASEWLERCFWGWKNDLWAGIHKPWIVLPTHNLRIMPQECTRDALTSTLKWLHYQWLWVMSLKYMKIWQQVKPVKSPEYRLICRSLAVW